ncbi:MAG: hypoxanthine phosphoribosyltransferase [Elusimicrobia bacterium]|nr:hypoxanthine phosphoribosyltransferase [Elusimicrobiota bacterium]
MVHPDIERILLDEDTIRARVKELAGRLSSDYAGKKPVMIGILKGSIPFMADLMRSMGEDHTVDFMCLSSYSGAASTGVVRMILDLRESIQDRDVLVVEDIIDTGLTLGYLRQNLLTRQPRSLELVTLLDKPDCRKVTISPKYFGFKIPNEFVVGYGLDYNEAYRHLPYIGVLKGSAVRGS